MRDRFIVELSKRATPLTQHFVRSNDLFNKHRSNFDDLVGAAVAKLASTVDRVSRGELTIKKPESVCEYFISAMWHAIRIEASESDLVRITDKSKRERFNAGRKKVSKMRSIDTLKDEETPAMPDEFAAAEMMELILSCCDSERQQTVIQRKSEGYTTTEIATELTVSKDTVERDLAAIYSRLQGQLED